MKKITKRPRVLVVTGFEKDILKLLQKHNLLQQGQMVQHVKIIIDTLRRPFVEIGRVL